ncbi:MAG: outer membrane beta-barrel domain-containing protein [Pseudomonadales bacterium]|nr:outer membrane beta-barrel domain-containing protein [Pseudomonadales bacterium]
MEVWNQRLVLVILLLLCIGHLFAAPAEEMPTESSSLMKVTPSDTSKAGAGRLIEPTLPRTEVRKARIDTENFQFGLHGGVINIEDFGSNPVTVARATYHVSEAIFLEADYGRTELSATSFERLSGALNLLTDAQRKVSYYDLSVGYNLLPGEIFPGRGLAFYSTGYIKAGVGNIHFADEEHTSFSLGAGLQIYATDYLALHLDVRDLIFSHDLLGDDRNTQNLEAVIGISFFF